MFLAKNKYEKIREKIRDLDFGMVNSSMYDVPSLMIVHIQNNKIWHQKKNLTQNIKTEKIVGNKLLGLGKSSDSSSRPLNLH